MAEPFLLDTNSYFVFFQHPTPPSYYRIASKLIKGGIISFYISEITSLEVQSVLGKYRRGVQSQRQNCERTIIKNASAELCSNIWITTGRRRLKPKLFRNLRKLISDIEEKKGNIKAEILSLNSDTIKFARNFMIKYSDRFNFGSHDALIAGSLLSEKLSTGLDLTLVTSDKGFIAALKEEGISYYDPNRL